MTWTSKCPLCSSDAATRIYQKTIRLRKDIRTGRQAFSNFFLEHVLKQTELKSAMFLCRNCFFMYFSPRMTAHDLQRIYSPDCLVNIRRYQEDFGTITEAQAAMAKASAGKRAAMIRDIVEGHADSRVDTILDFGGGTGENLSAFDGTKCKYVYDPCVTEPSPGIQIVKDIRDRAPYDVVAVTHVLEHVPNLREVWSSLVEVTAENGSIYVEVPYDFPAYIHEKIGLGESEHIQFFGKTSVRYLGSSHDLHCVFAQLRCYAIGHWSTEAVCAVFRKGNSLTRSPHRIARAASFTLECAAFLAKHYGKKLRGGPPGRTIS